MKISLLKILVLFFFSLSISSYSQNWLYDFGSGSSAQWTSGSSTTYLPSPPVDAGTSRVTVGIGGGFFQLNEPGLIDFGTNTELEGVAADLTGSLNKFSIYGYLPSTLFTIKFDVRFSDAASGDWAFFQGSGPTFSNDSEPPGGEEVFAGIWWQLKGNDTIITRYRTKFGWIPFTNDTLKAKTNYTFVIYGNNSNTMQTYLYNSSQTLDTNKYDVWVNDVLVLDDVSKDIIPDGNNINSFMFYGRNSRDNVSHIYLDNISYANAIISQSLPVELSSFKASLHANMVKLNWITQTETNNYGFDIERSLNNMDWKTIGFIPGSGNSNSPKEYSFTDKSLSVNGNYCYRLKQIDIDGQYEFSGVVEVKVTVASNDFKLFQNYPNPFNPTTIIRWQAPVDGMQTLKVFDVLGNEVAILVDEYRTAGYYEVEFDASNLSSGIYFCRFSSATSTEIMKMILSK